MTQTVPDISPLMPMHQDPLLVSIPMSCLIFSTHRNNQMAEMFNTRVFISNSISYHFILVCLFFYVKLFLFRMLCSSLKLYMVHVRINHTRGWIILICMYLYMCVCVYVCVCVWNARLWSGGLWQKTSLVSLLLVWFNCNPRMDK